MSAAPRAGRAKLALAGAGAALAVLALLATGAVEGVAYLAPALMVMSMLLLGRYPGERVLVKASAAPRAPARRPADRPCLSVHTRSGRSGRLLAAALAGRAPPVVRPR